MGVAVRNNTSTLPSRSNDTFPILPTWCECSMDDLKGVKSCTDLQSRERTTISHYTVIWLYVNIKKYCLMQFSIFILNPLLYIQLLFVYNQQTAASVTVHAVCAGKFVLQLSFYPFFIVFCPLFNVYILKSFHFSFVFFMPPLSSSSQEVNWPSFEQGNIQGQQL